MGWDKVEKDFESGPWGVFKWVAILLISFAILFGVLNSVGLVGKTAVERMVFEQSYQYKKGMESRAAILEANIAEIDMLIAQNPEDRADLLQQKSVLRAQLRAITINQ